HRRRHVPRDPDRRGHRSGRADRGHDQRRLRLILVMNMQNSDGSVSGGTRVTEPEQIQAIRLRHPWRSVFAVVLVLIAALFLYDTAFNRPVYNWAEVGKYLFDERIVIGAGYTLQL